MNYGKTTTREHLIALYQEEFMASQWKDPPQPTQLIYQLRHALERVTIQGRMSDLAALHEATAALYAYKKAGEDKTYAENCAARDAYVKKRLAEVGEK